MTSMVLAKSMVSLKRSKEGCPYPLEGRGGVVVEREVDDGGHVHIICLRPDGGGPPKRFVVDAHGQPMGPPVGGRWLQR